LKPGRSCGRNVDVLPGGRRAGQSCSGSAICDYARRRRSAGWQAGGIGADGAAGGALAAAPAGRPLIPGCPLPSRSPGHGGSSAVCSGSITSAAGDAADRMPAARRSLRPGRASAGAPDTPHGPPLSRTPDPGRCRRGRPQVRRLLTDLARRAGPTSDTVGPLLSRHDLPLTLHPR